MKTLEIVGDSIVIVNDYKAPHANRPTPPRKHWPRKKGHRKYLLKGLRP